MAGGFAAVYAVVMRDHHVRTRVFGPLNERGRGARSKVIVAVHKLDVFALCGRDARVARGGNARVWQMGLEASLLPSLTRNTSMFR